MIYLLHSPDQEHTDRWARAAAEFGPLRVCIEGWVNIFDFPAIEDHVVEALAGFGPDDLLAVTGNNLVQALGLRLLLARQPEVRLLIYSKKFDRCVEFPRKGGRG